MILRPCQTVHDSSKYYFELQNVHDSSKYYFELQISKTSYFLKVSLVNFYVYEGKNFEIIFIRS
jgi:hypothetical protein